MVVGIWAKSDDVSFDFFSKEIRVDDTSTIKKNKGPSTGVPC
jgi:hypothetical protein